jgi:hypothetical protein
MQRMPWPQMLGPGIEREGQGTLYAHATKTCLITRV